MKICIIGNSHVASLKMAWQNMFSDSEKQSFELTFFAAFSSKMKDIEYNNNSLVSKNQQLREALKVTSGGLESISLDDFDIFLTYGLDTQAYHKANDTFYSNAVSTQALKDFYTNEVIYKVLTELKRGTDKKIFIGCTPLVANPDQDNVPLNKKN